jgi:hypothetical protein
MTRGGSPVWAFIVGGLAALAGAWLLLNGLACTDVTSSLPSGATVPTGVSQFCSTYEWGGAALLAVGILIPVVALLVSRHGRGTSGREVGARRR